MILCSNNHFVPPSVDVCPECEEERRLELCLPNEERAFYHAFSLGDTEITQLLHIGDSKALASYGRKSQGGVACIDVLSGQVHWNVTASSAVPGVVLFVGEDGSQIAIASVGQAIFETGKVLGIAVETGQILWETVVSGAIATAPFIVQQRGYVACSMADNQPAQITVFDALTGQLVTPSVEYGSNRMLNAPTAFSVTVDGRHLLVGSPDPAGKGLYLISNDFTSAPAPQLLSEQGVEVKGQLQVQKDTVYGRCNQHIVAINLADRSVWQYPDVAISPPDVVAHVGVAYGGDKHTVQFNAPDSQATSWTGNTFGSVRAMPKITTDILYCGDTHSNIYAFDLQTGKQLWLHTVADPVDGKENREHAVTTQPQVFANRLVVGTKAGAVFVFPLVMGAAAHHEVAQLFAGRAKWQTAAKHWTLAMHYSQGQAREEFRSQAIIAFDNLHCYQASAALYEEDGNLLGAATSYVAAAIEYAKDELRALDYVGRAALLHINDDDLSQAQHVLREAAKRHPIPNIKIQTVSSGHLWLHKENEIQFEVKNIGRDSAWNVEVLISGNIAPVAEVIRPSDALQPYDYWRILATIQPKQTEGTLGIEIRYQDKEKRLPMVPFKFTFPITAELDKSIVINAQDMARNKIRINSSNNVPIKLNIGDSVMTELIIDDSGARQD